MLDTAAEPGDTTTVSKWTTTAPCEWRARSRSLLHAATLRAGRAQCHRMKLARRRVSVRAERVRTAGASRCRSRTRSHRPRSSGRALRARRRGAHDCAAAPRCAPTGCELRPAGAADAEARDAPGSPATIDAGSCVVPGLRRRSASARLPPRLQQRRPAAGVRRGAGPDRRARAAAQAARSPPRASCHLGERSARGRVARRGRRPSSAASPFTPGQ